MALAFVLVIATGLLLPEGKPRRLFGEAGLVRALGEAVGEDGGMLSRSPLAQMDAIALLVELIACYRAVRRDPPQAIEASSELICFRSRMHSTEPERQLSRTCFDCRRSCRASTSCRAA